MEQKEALEKLVDWIRCGCRAAYASYGYQVYLPALIEELAKSYNDRFNLSRSIFDAAWELCRRGILRPGVEYIDAQPTDVGSSGQGFSLTSFGRVWIVEDQNAFVPTEPERFAQMLEPFRLKFGDGFFQRGNEAVRCYDAHAYLACCVMCGAAMESVLLASVIAQEKDENSVLRKYKSSHGRVFLEKRFLPKENSRLKTELLRYTPLLKYWRDEAAHGSSSGITENESYTSLALLLRFCSLVADNWAEMTGHTQNCPILPNQV